MTCCDYNVVMKKGVGIADLKARLSEHLGAVRKGRTVTVLDRGTPIARIVPLGPMGPMGNDTLEVRKATRRARDIPELPPPAKKTDSLKVLLDDRRR